MSVVAMALVSLLAAPLACADDYAFLGRTDNLFDERSGAPVVMADDGSESDDVCSCQLCTEAIGESVAPRIGPPNAYDRFGSASAYPISSLYCPEVFRPPTS
ncbi:MAG: hypothetical protein HY896_04415 [Deltaproteobacteria bacterium]|nr:hypothetical protein [Deltaproteobacteria bacterium]